MPLPGKRKEAMTPEDRTVFDKKFRKFWGLIEPQFPPNMNTANSWFFVLDKYSLRTVCQAFANIGSPPPLKMPQGHDIGLECLRIDKGNQAPELPEPGINDLPRLARTRYSKECSNAIIKYMSGGYTRKEYYDVITELETAFHQHAPQEVAEGRARLLAEDPDYRPQSKNKKGGS